MDALTSVVRPRLPISMSLSLPTLRHGPRDPTVRIRRDEVWRAARTPRGAAPVRYAARGDEIVGSAWGAGAAWWIETGPAGGRGPGRPPRWGAERTRPP